MSRTVIEADGKNLQYWRDILKYRSLAATLAKRDITVRYKQTFIGLGWSVISPVVNMFLMSFVFGHVAKLSTDGQAPYSVMVYAGLIPWTLFSRNLQIASATFLTSAGLMKKVYFPRIIVPLGTSLATFIDTLISLGVLLVIMLTSFFTTGFVPSPRMLLLPLFALLPSVLGFSAGLFLSPLNIRFRDLNQAIPFLINIGQYVTPVAYSFTVACAAVPQKFRFIYSLNPAAGAINAFRWCIIPTNEFHWPSFLSALVFIAVFIPLGIRSFRKGERNFVDLV
ncbi:MAG: ABC transporter permease [Clostridiales bacterium]|jgi:lipopolysaccharide transport system permease protein|nr:ABC transporter permease [Clostridiales bacterium]